MILFLNKLIRKQIQNIFISLHSFWAKLMDWKIGRVLFSRSFTLLCHSAETVVWEFYNETSLTRMHLKVNEDYAAEASFLSLKTIVSTEIEKLYIFPC